MKKSHLILLVLLLMVIGYATTQIKLDINGRTELSENISDFKVYLDNLKLNGTEIEGINETKDGYEINIPSKGTLEYDVINDSTEYDVEATVECEEENTLGTATEFTYTGSEQTFTVPITGTYKLETWGAQGYTVNSYTGGYGGYSTGIMNLLKNDNIYIFVGEKGKGGIGNGTRYSSYPNSSDAGANDKVSYTGSGGGSTHIAYKNLLIKDITDLNDLIMVSGGGGASTWTSGNGWSGIGGSGGGIKGNSGKSVIASFTPGGGGTQTAGGVSGNEGTSGQFGLSLSKHICATCGGGGYYGGGSSWGSAGGGGSGYIGNSLLTEKSMYCYNCSSSSEESTKTISTTCVSSTPKSNCAKSGNGYARITLMNVTNYNIQLETTTIEAQEKISNKVEVENNGIKCSLKIKKLSRTEKKVYTGATEWTFNYTGGEQTFIAPVSGKYKLETWGAQGGKGNEGVGGYGGYSQGYIQLEKTSKVFVNVGGAGIETVDRENVALGGYNGGGPAFACGGKFECGTNATNAYVGSGGGATHIASVSGVLANLATNVSKILIVAGAGGGNYGTHNGGSGGGISGNSGVGDTIYATGGTQTSGGLDRNGFNGSFGLGSLWLEYVNSKISFTGSGGGSGLYGGGRGFYNSSGGGGGSGYVGNTLLSEKAMYCYNCEESTEESTKTISTTCVSETPTENCAKSGNGYARITLIK